MVSYKAMVKTPGDKDWVCNALRFATYEEAEAYGIDLARRWTLVIARETQESDDPVTEDHPYPNSREA
jgi:hypothetical protein